MAPHGAATAGALKLYATDVTARLKRVATAFLGASAGEVTLVDL